MAISLYPVPKVQYFDDDGTPLAGGKVYFYTPGTANLKDTFTTQAGTVANSNPVVLDANGRAEIWLNGIYDVRLDRADDTTVWTVDNVSSAGATTATEIDEWIAPGDTPTFISTTKFSVTGDQTTIYQVGRRVKCTVTAGTVYGRVSAVAFTTITTVTVVLDSGNLDSGLSVVNIGILSRTNSSVPTMPDATALELAVVAQQIVKGELNYIADTGAADVYVATLPIALAAYVNGMPVCVKITNANLTTTPTLNVSAISADTIKREGGAALLVGDLPAGYMAIFRHDGTDWILINPALVAGHAHTSVATGGVLAAPTITSFANATHNHSDAAGGGTLGEDAIDWATAGGLVQLQILEQELTHTGDLNWTTVESTRVYIPADANSLEYMGRIKSSSGSPGDEANFRLTCASADGTDEERGSGTYDWQSALTLDISAESGWTTINLQLKQNDAAQTAFVNRAVLRII